MTRTAPQQRAANVLALIAGAFIVVAAAADFARFAIDAASMVDGRSR